MASQTKRWEEGPGVKLGRMTGCRPPLPAHTRRFKTVCNASCSSRSTHNGCARAGQLSGREARSSKKNPAPACK